MARPSGRVWPPPLIRAWACSADRRSLSSRARAEPPHHLRLLARLGFVKRRFRWRDPGEQRSIGWRRHACPQWDVRLARTGLWSCDTCRLRRFNYLDYPGGLWSGRGHLYDPHDTCRRYHRERGDNLGAAGLNSYGAKLMFGDWLWWSDQVNNTIRLVSPQGFAAGRLANLSPEQSSLNKQIYGVIGSQRTGAPGSGQNTTTRQPISARCWAPAST